MATSDLVSMRQHGMAHARTGDKGKHSNISLFAYQPKYYSILVDQVTEQRVADLFAHCRPMAVKRFLLPKLHRLNFVLEKVLDGGVNESLNLDIHGKALSFLLLVATDVGTGRDAPQAPRNGVTTTGARGHG